MVLYAPSRQTQAGGFDLSNYYAAREFEVWPENWPAVRLFTRLGTQWRTSMAGATGIDYGVLFRLMDEQGLKGDDWAEVFADVQVLEAQALETMRASD